ncbi:MAG: hypothetical protein EBT86_10490 [Actinobacteria bacterium]|nr:hypothetical protein [Actinomycetota bacterium]
MSISQTATTSFKIELLQGVHNFGPTSPNTFKIALFTAAASIGPTTTQYASGMTGEVSGTGYSAGGNTLTISLSPTSGNNSSNVPTAYISFNNTTWSNATFTARGALIYNLTQGNKSVAVLDFGSDKTVSNDIFTITFPSPDANSAIVRIS